ncbi:hypothetical protein H1Z61_07040 [Bacillus aquiflavi]|uniref:DUF2178 domain-containing protein n=1 Tax=Bacillus aquiflavi TaxID=2672567 RepID=A0A6B3VTF5_9BACI|nr:hypothetical protein [Bacillus aquiflavi]MBA4536902.1 hypothetical protein [Bacillus aquiflavi]NEY81269.1 hypothetical protein [Bacillus aquiflavi]UAC47620.1 hypothetical protein K6959_13250 [Bacillus aquiflavi]
MNIRRNGFITVTVLVLFGWAMVAFYDAQIQFAEVIKNQPSKWEIELHLTPLLAALLIGGALSAIMFVSNRKKRSSLKQAFLLPPELEEMDEREKQITAKACRASYISMGYLYPIVTGLMLFYPFVNEMIPYYPIIVILLLPFIQFVVYFISLKRNY